MEYVARGYQFAASDSDSETRKFNQLQGIRALIGSGITLFLAQSVELGLHAGWLVLAVLFGTLFAGILLKREVRFRWVLLHHILGIVTCYCLSLVINSLILNVSSSPHSDFAIPQYLDSLLLVGLFYGAAFLGTWIFWTRTYAVTLEGLLSSLLFIWLLSAHRNYRIDAPKQISSLTWKWEFLQKYHVEPQLLFIAVGALFLLLLTAYLVLAQNRQLFGQERVLKSYGKRRIFSALVAPALMLLGLYLYATHLNQNYKVESSRSSSGVGGDESAKEGQSNLGFHQAISQTKQPSALVRLEGDFAQNPWAPMIYFREGALSEFNGKELVNAGSQFDSDIPPVSPGQPFLSSTPPGENREKLVQSIYLLTDHQAPFSADVPQRIAPIENPYPDRFRLAYQVVSSPPITPVTELLGSTVGSPSWDKKQWEHYLRAPGSKDLSNFLPELVPEAALESDAPVVDAQGEDLRYLALSKKLTEELSDPVEKASAILTFLSEQSIYTRNPGHEATQRGDPVAPYLFDKEKRGYCVHFAHAAVYLLRLAGIPSRIATGYLTDLTYAKDGHILLHLGDRHAWPEFYVDGTGWVVFDITPARAENEQALVPDENLLDELMSKLNPAKELLEPQPLDAPSEKGTSIAAKVFTLRTLLALVAFILLFLLLAKLWLRFGYLLANSNARRTRLAYRSFLASMADVGLPRFQGETRMEYSRRLSERFGIDASNLTKFNEVTVYYDSSRAPNASDLQRELAKAVRSYDSRNSKVWRYMSFFNPFPLGRVRTW